MVKTSTIGFPQIGMQLEYKKGLKSFFHGDLSEGELFKIGYEIRTANLKKQLDEKIDIIACNDFSWHDEVWDTSLLIGNIPSRYYWEGGEVPTEIYFAPSKGHRKDKFEVPGMEIRPYFNTKTYYTVPEFQDGINFVQSDNKIIQHYIEAKSITENVRPVILGPVSYMLLGKVYDSEDEKFTQIDIEKTLNEIVDVYLKLCLNLKRVNVKSVQINEPCLSSNFPIIYQKLFLLAYEKIKNEAKDIEIMLFTGFSDISHNEDLILSLPIDKLHINVLDLSNEKLERILQKTKNKKLSLGLVRGDDVFISDLKKSISIGQKFLKNNCDIEITTTCSLSYCPLDVSFEKTISQDLKQYLSFANQKLSELNLIKNYLNGDFKKEKEIEKNAKLHETMYSAIQNIKQKAINPDIKKKSENEQQFPIFPTTTIGTFGQISNKTSSFSEEKLQSFMEKQSNLGFSILSTGEFNRKTTEFDHFVQFLSGSIVNTNNAYIKTYFNSVEKFPIVFGDFDLDSSKISQMFEQEIEAVDIANSLKKPIKYRITGPVTAMHRSFCFEKNINKVKYLSLFSSVCKNISKLAIKNGFSVIQLDENNLLNEADIMPDGSESISKINDFIKNTYSEITDKAKIHIYFPNSNIAPKIDEISDLKVDLVILESFRSTHDIIKDVSSYKYDGNIAIGFFDPNSYHTPSAKDINSWLKFAIRSFDIDKLWLTYDSHFKENNANIDQAMKNVNEAILLCRERFSKFG